MRSITHSCAGFVQRREDRLWVLNPDCFVRNQIRIHLSWSPIAGSGGEEAAIGIGLCPARANPIRWFP